MLTYRETLIQAQARAASFQVGINAQYGLTGNVKQARLEVTSYADDGHCQYPQYKGHWDDYELVRVTMDLTTKSGVAFLKGDITIGKRNSSMMFGTDFTVYSIRNAIDTRLNQCVETL